MRSSPAHHRRADDDRVWSRWVLLALLVGAGLRLVLAASDDVVTNDGTAYLRSGASIWDGEGFRREGHPELHFPPAFPAVVGGAERLLGDPLRASATVTFLASTALLIPLVSLAHRFGGRRAAVPAAWFAALAPGLVDVPVTSGSGNEVVFLLAVLLLLRLSVMAYDRTGPLRYAAAAGAGLLGGAAYLTRPEGLAFAAIGLAAIGLPALARSTTDRGSRLIAAGVMGATLLVCAAPYVSYLHDNTGKWELTAKANDASLDAWKAVARHDRRARDAVIYELDDTGTDFVAPRASLTALAREDPSGYLGIVRVNVGELWDNVAVPVDRPNTELGWALIPVPFSVLALWGAWRTRRRRGTWFLVAALLAPTLTALAFFVQARYLIPATAFVCILAGIGFAQLPPRWVRPAGALAGVLLVLSLAGAADGAEGLFNRREPVEQAAVGRWIAEHTPEDARIMTRSMVVEYYADRRAVPIPYADQQTVLDFARYHGVDFFVVDEYGFDELRPQLLGLFDAPPPEGTRVVYRDKYHGRDVIVLALEPTGLPESPLPPAIGFMGDG